MFEEEHLQVRRTGTSDWRNHTSSCGEKFRVFFSRDIRVHGSGRLECDTRELNGEIEGET